MSLRQIAIKTYQEVIAEALARDAKVKAKTSIGPNMRDVRRHLCKTDLFYLLVFELNRQDINRDWTFDRCIDVQTSPNGHLDLWSREHYKSTIITYGKTIQDIIKNPEITVGFFSHTRGISKDFLVQIKREFEENNMLKVLFDDVLYANPRKESPKWSEDDGLIVKRKTNPKESTLEAWGLVDGQPTGKHFLLMVYDDVVTLESVSTPAMIDKTTNCWALSRNLAARGGAVRYIGTRYHFNDTYKVMLDRKSASPRVFPATHDGTVTGKPVLLTQEELDEKRRDMGSHVFSSQMLLNPVADEAQGFKEEWLNHWDCSQYSGMNVYLLCDPANSKKTSSDYTVFMVIGAASDKNYYVIDIIRDRLSLTERANKLFYLHSKYQPIAVGYERYGMQADIDHFKDRMQRENYRFNIIELKGNTPKNDRIRRLIPLFEYGRVYLPERLLRKNYEGRTVNLVEQFINDEYKAFPVSIHDDMLDCLARIVEPDLNVRFPSSSGAGAFKPNRGAISSPSSSGGGKTTFRPRRLLGVSSSSASRVGA